MDKVYIVTVDEWLDDHYGTSIAGVYSSLDKANEFKDELIPIFKQEEEEGQNDGFDINVDQMTIDAPDWRMSGFLRRRLSND